VAANGYLPDGRGDDSLWMRYSDTAPRSCGSAYDSSVALAALAGEWASGITVADLLHGLAPGGVEPFAYGPTRMEAGWVL
jgi:hypothetical protein